MRRLLLIGLTMVSTTLSYACLDCSGVGDNLVVEGVITASGAFVGPTISTINRRLTDLESSTQTLGLTASNTNYLSVNATGDLNMSSYAIVNATQIAFVGFRFDEIRRLRPKYIGSLIQSENGAIFISTGAGIGSWAMVAQPRELSVGAATGAVSIWEFDPDLVGGITSRSTFDSLHSSITGTLLGDTTKSVFISSGINFTAAYANSPSTGIIRVPNDALFSPHAGAYTVGRMAISLWVYPHNNAAAGNRRLLSKRQASNFEYDINYDESGQIQTDLLTAAGSAVSQFSSTPLLNNNNWNHVVVQIDKTQADGSKTTLTVNGNLASGSSTDAGSGTTANGTAPLIFGNWLDSGGAAFCDCIIDKVKFFDRRLTTTETSNLFAEKVR